MKCYWNWVQKDSASGNFYHNDVPIMIHILLGYRP
ncbi:hypothetical protein HNQ64_003927 [Prosthecobacter dejongeii]|uniref:Uncharacterized protein n=1 Tax=Prosthecobacter dejongeii TaxID=48465 RepID=A0A7W7YP56_9BACT|nr:hypothetical protein [Prosthecobacter dejongeii]